MLHKYSPQRKQAEMNTTRITKYPRLCSKSIKWEGGVFSPVLGGFRGLFWLWFGVFFGFFLEMSLAMRMGQKLNIFITQLTGDYTSTPCFPVNQALEAPSS